MIRVKRMLATIVTMMVIAGHERGSGGGCCCDRSCCSRGRRRTIDVTARILFLPLCAPILKPNFHLCFRQTQRQCQIQAFTYGQVARLLELILQCDQLFVCESGASSPRLTRTSAFFVIVIVVVVLIVAEFVVIIFNFVIVVH